jgi:hypothetical protein
MILWVSTGEGDIPMPEQTSISDLSKAIQLAKDAMRGAAEDPDQYSLVSSERMLGGGPHCASVRCWQLTFKLKRLIPTELLAPLGAGGELFFTVDLDAGQAILTGRGE